MGGEENFTELKMYKTRPRWRRGIQTHGMTMTRYVACSLCEEPGEGLGRKVINAKEHKGDTLADLTNLS